MKSSLWLLKLAAFAVYMQHGEGIENKSPDYMIEKWNLIQSFREEW